MRHLLRFTSLILGGFLALGLSGRAQTATAHAPDGGTTFHIQSIDIAPLTGAPFTATVTTEWSRTLADGSTATTRNHRTVARDSTGRIFQERRRFTSNGDVQPTPLDALEYVDPVRHEFLNCIPQRKTCYTSTYLRSQMDKMSAGVGGLGGVRMRQRAGQRHDHHPRIARTEDDRGPWMPSARARSRPCRQAPLGMQVRSRS